MSVPTAPPPVTGRQSSWTAGRVVVVVLGSILGLVGVAVTLFGGALTWATATQRDGAGFFHTDAERFSVGSYAITSDEVDLRTDVWRRRAGFDLGDLVRVRIRATPASRGHVLFLGIGRARDVRDYLRGVGHDEISDIDLRPFRVEYRTLPGDAPADPPGDQSFWAASSTRGRPLVWEPESGRFVVVLMNADASRGVAADVEVGVQVRHLWVIVAGVLALGVVLLAVGVILIIVGTRRATRTQPPPPSPAPTSPPIGPLLAPSSTAPVVPATMVPVASPVRLDGRLDEPLSRWLWIVKWLLAIPHYIVLAVLWLAVIVVTIVAGFAVLFTGRYPRGIFDFTVGVLRWTWRVLFYSSGVLGTDRYPPFTLGPAPDYPAALDIAYPDRLSRGLVLVKWWLLAIPQYVVIGVIGTGWWPGVFAWGRRDWSPVGWGTWHGGLLGILVLVAAVRLLFTERYPRDMFGLVVGLHRWVFRVAAYALLMTDQYPPFRLDLGGADPSAPSEPGLTWRVQELE